MSERSPERLAVRGAGGVVLAADHWPAPGAQPVVLLHGGGQTRHAWKQTGAVLADRGYEVVALDLRGHGESDWASDGNYAFDAFRDDVRAVIGRLARPPVLVGASLGGIAALLAAGEGGADDDGSGKVRALVLVDITHRPAPEGSAKIQRFMTGGSEGFDTLEAAADAVAAYLPHRPRPADTAGLRKNLRERDGRLYWHWDPGFLQVAAGDRGREDGRLHRAAAALRVPTLLVRGTRSDIVTAEDAAAFVELVPGATLVEAVGAAHMVAGDENTVFGEALLGFLAEVAAPLSIDDRL